MNYALIIAGGSGNRMGQDIPKQFMHVNNCPIIIHTLQAFQQHPDITDIHVVCLARWEEYVQQQARQGSVSKFRGSYPSGTTAYLSICQGIEGLLSTYDESEDIVVLVHDAVRPLISYEIIGRNIQVCRTNGNAITAVQSNEAYLCTNGGDESSDYIQRESLMRAQTPHTFPLSELKKILATAKQQGIETHQSLFTLCNEIGYHPLYIAQGDMMNFKLTEPNDIKIYQALKDLIL